MIPLDVQAVSDIIQRGGTMIYTARCPEFKEWNNVLKAKQICDEANMCGVVVIGGDGSFRGAADLSKAGVPCVGIPGTIDNDIQCSEYTIGFDTAMNTVVEMIDKLRDTSHSHERCAVVEVMGRHAGHIAVNTGLACGATAVLVPEVGYDIESVIKRITEVRAAGKKTVYYRRRGRRRRYGGACQENSGRNRYRVKSYYSRSRSKRRRSHRTRQGCRKRNGILRGRTA